MGAAHPAALIRPPQSRAGLGPGEKREGTLKSCVPRGLPAPQASRLRGESAFPAVSLLRPDKLTPLHEQEAVGSHVQCRICPSPRAFGLFAAEGLYQTPEARRAGQV